MTADLFLTCFLACMFAFVVFGVLAFQIGGFLLKRAATKYLPEILATAIRGADAMPPAELDELMKISGLDPRGKNLDGTVIPHLPVVKCKCGREQSVPPELPLAPFLEKIGWRWKEQNDGWSCPVCAGGTRDAA